MCNGKAIGYLRVSTQKQGESGLGLEAQEEALRCYAKSTDSQIVKTYREVESGKRSDRPELSNALAHAKRSGATLIIAKLDRLARNVHFVSGLMESGVDFVCCDNPHANRLTIHILAAVAEDEAKRISDRTKAALAAYKARGGVLGAARPDGHRFNATDSSKGARLAAMANVEAADKAYSDLAHQMLEWRDAGLSQQAIADRLNAEGHTTRRGKPWNQVQVMRVLRRAQKITRKEPPLVY